MELVSGADRVLARPFPQGAADPRGFVRARRAVTTSGPPPLRAGQPSWPSACTPIPSGCNASSTCSPTGSRSCSTAPGTGKTFLAREIAAHLADSDAVRIVQFHPPYSYEDFFEGYRPTPGSDGPTSSLSTRSTEATSPALGAAPDARRAACLSGDERPTPAPGRATRGVPPLLPAASLPQWRPTRRNARYHAALRIAELVLRLQSFEVGSGGLRIAAFVVDMAKVFEDFVGIALREAWAGYPGQTLLQHEADFDDAGVMRIRADVVHCVAGVPRIVADAKYKIESSTGRYSNHDHDQMLAYCNALRIPVAWLVYASGAQGSVTRRVCNTDIELVEYPLRLDEAPSSLLAQIADLASRAQHAWRRRG
ncbi:MAG: 5-methylcytosine restriction system specificity protein McrC [Acidimicrobiales bacterium]